MRNYALLLFVFYGLYGCGPAATDPTRVEEVRATISIQFYNEESMSIDAVLLNGKDKVIAADSTQLFVNDSAMYYFVKQDLYYGKHPGFSYVAEICRPAKDSILHFKIKFHNDSVLHEIGSINLSGITNVFNLKDPIIEAHNKQQPLLLPIQKTFVDSVVLYQSYMYKGEGGNPTYSGGPYDSLAKQIAISKDTTLQIPAHYFQRPNVTVEGIGYDLIQYRIGQLKPAFANSSIQAKASVDGIIPLH